jgi:hypothetical protein
VPNTFSLHIYFVNEHGHVEHRSVRMEGKKGGNGSYTFAANALDIEKLKEDVSLYLLMRWGAADALTKTLTLIPKLILYLYI